MSTYQPTAERGRFRFGFTMLGSGIHVEHGVEADQHEPGIPDDGQADRHVLDIGLMEWALDGQVGVHDRLAFEFNLPMRMNVIRAEFVDAGGQTLDEFTSIHHRDETIFGLGDMTVGARLGFFRPTDVLGLRIDTRVGLSLPTGNTEPDPFELGGDGKEHQHMFFGSGTVDPVLGLQGTYSRAKWMLLAWTQLRVPLYSNKHGYRPSTLSASGLGVGSGFGLERWRFLLQQEVYVETPARWRTSTARNSGRTSLLAALGAFFTPVPAWQVFVVGKLPYYTKAKGGQLRWPFVGLLGVAYTFSRGHKH